ncbi:unnamed protein product [Commensalibacter communis]|nr:hypothetical protein [Commensalibacter communis]CAI3949589.1 unnamed protein product [Commensalibacter communis]CAI3955174.1 unnamed protein product [Commensalibacter communis]CAI3957812.1 unnamed protein product [Commensalibacter communis]CAI3958466.1 unnamed protein product [Commensalibacter communis]
MKKPTTKPIVEGYVVKGGVNKNSSTPPAPKPTPSPSFSSSSIFNNQKAK